MSLTAGDAERLAECLAGDALALIPTDTVYGLACNPNSELALRRVYELKHRPPLKPAAVMFFTLDAALEALSDIEPRTRAAILALLPGPVTLLLANPGGRFPLACAPGNAHLRLLGLRVPLFDGALDALTAVGVPAAQSSANISGGPDPRSLGEVPIELREGVDLTLDCGELAGIASTVIDLSDYERAGRWQVVREGPLDRDAVAAALA
jgi:L-threonylcarbamoyladenylate synthase